MTVLARTAGFVAYLIGPEDGIEGWQVCEYRGPRERASLVTLNRSRLIEQWRIGKVRWQQ